MERPGLWRRLRAIVRPQPVHPCGQPLLTAATHGDLAAVNRYLERGVPPDQVRTEEGQTALYLAVREGHRPVVKALLAAGADPTIEDAKGAGALTIAAAYGRVDIVKKCLRARTTVCESQAAALALRRAALNGCRVAVRVLLEGGVPANAVPRDWPPALHAAACSDVGCVAELLAGGADHALRDQEGRTALHWAVRTSQEGCVRLLLTCGADRRARDRKGRDPSHEVWSDSMLELLRTPPPRRRRRSSVPDEDEGGNEEAGASTPPPQGCSPVKKCVLS